jgi:hypothetical protein
MYVKRGNVRSDLRVRRERVANIGTREINESNRKQDVNAAQEIWKIGDREG